MHRFAVLLLLAALPNFDSTYAQPVPEASDASRASPPSWLAWRAFYLSMAQGGGPATDEARSMLKLRLDVSNAELTAVLDAGRDYLISLSNIDDYARERVAMVRSGLPSPSQMLQSQYADERVVQGTLHVRVDISQALRDSLTNNGVVADVHRQRQDAYESHHRQLARVLGPAQLEALVSLVETEVATKAVTFSPRLPKYEGPAKSFIE